MSEKLPQYSPAVPTGYVLLPMQAVDDALPARPASRFTVVRAAAIAVLIFNAMLLYGLATYPADDLFGGAAERANPESAVSEDSTCPIRFKAVDQFGVYQDNRRNLAAKISTSKNENNFVLVVGGRQLTRFGSDTDLPFRQDSDFLYLTGYDRADLYVAMSLRAPFDTYLFYPPMTQSEIIFNGAKEDPKLIAERYGFKDVLPNTGLVSSLAKLFPNATEVLTTDTTNLKDSLPEVAKKYSVAAGGVLTNLRSMRQVKTDKELDMIRVAAQVSAAAHVEAMKAAAHVIKREGSWLESGAENVFRFITNSCGLKIQAYMPIVGAGVHSGVLHYVNNDDIIHKDAVVLVDAAAEYYGYASDITRTYPASGKFTKEQRDIYEIVLNAQEAAIAALKPGVYMSSISKISTTKILEGLLEKGLVTGTMSQLETYNIAGVFMPHGLSHGVGLDVHDPSATVLTERTVLTIEPGVYFIPVQLDSARADANKSKFINWTVVDKYRSFGGVRIEDVIIVGNGTPEVVSKDAPKSVKDIEALMLGL